MPARQRSCGLCPLAIDFSLLEAKWIFLAARIQHVVENDVSSMLHGQLIQVLRVLLDAFPASTSFVAGKRRRLPHLAMFSLQKSHLAYD